MGAMKLVERRAELRYACYRCQALIEPGDLMLVGLGRDGVRRYCRQCGPGRNRKRWFLAWPFSGPRQGSRSTGTGA